MVVIWHLAVTVLQINAVLLPPPADVAEAFITKWDVLLRHTAITMSEASLGFLLGGATAYAVAIAFSYSNTLRIALYPYAVALKSTPLIALSPLLVLWFGNGITSKIVMAGLVSFFPVLVNSVDGLAAVDREMLDLMHSLSATRWQVLKMVRLPHSIPYLLSGLKVSSSLAVVGAVIGEFTGATEGIGYLINTSSYYLDTGTMFAAVISIGTAGVLFFLGVALVHDRVVGFRR